MGELDARVSGAGASDQARSLPDRAAPLLRDRGVDGRRQRVRADCNLRYGRVL